MDGRGGRRAGVSSSDGGPAVHAALRVGEWRALAGSRSHPQTPVPVRRRRWHLGNRVRVSREGGVARTASREGLSRKAPKWRHFRAVLGAASLKRALCA